MSHHLRRNPYMKRRVLVCHALTLVLSAWMNGCVVASHDDTTNTGGQGGTGGVAQVPALDYTIDVALAPVPASISDGKGNSRPLGAVRDDQGVVSKFVQNEILIAPKDQAELDAFKARYNATIVGDNTVPA